MAKIWIKGYTKDDGTKVNGYWREVQSKFSDRKTQAAYVNRLRLMQDPDKARNITGDQVVRRFDAGRSSSIRGLKKSYGKALRLKDHGYESSLLKYWGSKI